MPKRILWPKVKRIYWCGGCNTPLLQPTCPQCGTKGSQLPLSSPGDARLAFDRDLLALQKAYWFEFGTMKGFQNLVGASVILLNKAPYYDEMKEVFCDGMQVGRLYYDPFLRTWRFRLSKVGALRVLPEVGDAVHKVITTKMNYRPMDVLRIDRDLPKYKQVLLIEPGGEVVGLAYSKGGNRLVVHSWWGRSKVSTEPPKRRSSIEDVIKLHDEHIYIIESRAKKLITVMAEKIGGELVVSFSGGKDSLTALHLTLEAGFEPDVLFNNTGIELPETVNTVYKVVDSYGLRLVEASAGDAFWRAVQFFGIPGRDYRWCCKVCKLAPLLRAVKTSWQGGAINVVGQRAFESLDRARSPQVWRLRWAPYLLNLSPINEWSQFEVWLYILKHKLYVNPLYYMGYERIGCFMCPASTLAELNLVAETHKDLWGRWLEVLRSWATKLSLPSEWIEYGLWRWNAPARYKTIMARKLSIVKSVNDWRSAFYKVASPKVLEVVRETRKVSIALEGGVPQDLIVDNVHILKPLHVFVSESAPRRIRLRWCDAELVISMDKIEASLLSESATERLVDLLKLIYRGLNCVGCRSCELNCPEGIIKVVEAGGRYVPRLLNRERCRRCRLCLYNCPIAEVYVEHIVTPLLFNNPEAWRRKTREHHREVLRKLKDVLSEEILIKGRSRTLKSQEGFDLGQGIDVLFGA